MVRPEKDLGICANYVHGKNEIVREELWTNLAGKIFYYLGKNK